MLKGGYQIIDLEDREFKIGVGQVFEGIYDRIEGNRKAILISGLNVDGIEKRDCYTYPEIDGTSYDCIVGIYRVHITDRDIVTVYLNEGNVTVVYSSYDDSYAVITPKEYMKSLYDSKPECVVVDVGGVFKSKVFNINTYESNFMRIECHSYYLAGGILPTNMTIMSIDIQPDGTSTINNTSIT